jgi:hypothetical protein
MATLQATKVSSGTEQMPGIGDGQSAKVMASTYTWAAAPGASDIIQSALIQSGSVITDVTIVHTGLGTSGTFEVGYGADTDYFIASASQSAAGVVRMSAATALPLTLTTNDTVDVKVNAAGASAAGTIAIIVTFLPRNA